jgi:hypothetical protein
MTRPRKADMPRGRILDEEVLTAPVAELTMDLVFLPSTRGLFKMPNVPGRSPGSRIRRFCPPSRISPVA